MEILCFEEFLTYCNKSFCIRKTIISKNCLKVYKQESCYKKYLENCNKQFENMYKFDNDKQFRSKIIARDKTCRIWNILNQDEKKFIFTNYYEEYDYLSKILDVCHAVARSRSPELIYEEDNVFLSSRYFHSLLDSNKDLITQKSISSEKTESWITRIMNENNFWSENYQTYYKRKVNK